MFKKKYLKIILTFLSVFIFCFAVQAADKVEPPRIDLQVPIRGQPEAGKDLASYISAWYTFGLGAVGVIAVVMIMWAGFEWMTAAGSGSMISDAKKKISNALVGLVLALCSYGLLYLINPALVELKLPVLEKITKVAMKEGIKNRYSCLYLKKEACEKKWGCQFLEKQKRCEVKPMCRPKLPENYNDIPLDADFICCTVGKQEPKVAMILARSYYEFYEKELVWDGSSWCKAICGKELFQTFDDMCPELEEIYR